MADESFGRDVSTFPDLDMTGRTITGPRVLAERCLRILSTPTGWLPYAPEDGYDLSNLLNEDLDDTDLRRHEIGSEQALERDEYIRTASVALDLDRVAFTLKVRITGETVTGTTFAFTLAIGHVSASVLAVE